MADHTIKIDCPDGSSHSAMVTLDDRTIYCQSITVHLEADNLVQVTIGFDATALEITGMADVVAELTKDE